MFIGTRSFPRSLQLDDYSCGSRAVYSVLTHFDVRRAHSALKVELGTSPNSGTAVHQMIRVLRLHGMMVGYRPSLNWGEVVKALKVGAVVIVHLDGDHLGTVFGADERHVHVADPSLVRCFGRKQARREFFQALVALGPRRATPSRSGHGIEEGLTVMGLLYRISPRCFRGRPYDQACRTPACVELQKSPTYLRDELLGQIHIAKTMLAEGNIEADWAAAVRELEVELLQFDAHRGAAAFRQ